MNIKRTFSGASWESQVGYCRGVRVNNHIYISGTAPIAEGGEVFAPGDGYAQAKRCLEIIQKALQDLGADINSVVRTRMFVTDISRWAEFGQAHQEVFGENPPATSMVEVKSLIDPAMLIEIEVDAIRFG
jgi:enamine deaminase RidA (YjgF/YER057c/UK114 family)